VRAVEFRLDSDALLDAGRARTGGRVNRSPRSPAGATVAGSRSGAPPMDAAARDFIEDVRVDPWFALELPLPDDLDLAALQEVRPRVYALLHALGFTVDEATPLIGLLAEIDRRIALMELLQSPNRETPARNLGKAINPARPGRPQPLSDQLPPALGDSADQDVVVFAYGKGREEPQ
jgi:hypothetical protein